VSRPRLWIPGLVYVTDDGELCVGRSAGYGGEGPAFSDLRCGRRRSLEHWTHTAWLVARRSLDRKLVDEQGIILPESSITEDDLPHAHRWLREQPLLCVSGLGVARLREAGVRVYRVALDASAERVLELECEGGKTPPGSLRVPLDALCAAGSGADRARGPAIDRLLRLVSDGVLDEQAVLAAFDARSLVEDGYGYRGALEGKFSSIDCVERALRPLDVLFGQVYERAEPMRELGAAVCSVLKDAPADVAELELAGYGAARRTTVPALRVALEASVENVLGGEPVSELELPAESRWSVDGIEPWSPVLGPSFGAAGNDRSAGSAVSRSPWRLVPWLVLALLLAAAWLVLRGR
jgi:hypothetical protein